MVSVLFLFVVVRLVGVCGMCVWWMVVGSRYRYCWLVWLVEFVIFILVVMVVGCCLWLVVRVCWCCIVLCWLLMVGWVWCSCWLVMVGVGKSVGWF